jgi:peptidoglycan/LPS O-acetylase OafA/YrhL
VNQARRIDALTGLRPFASLYVFFFHFGRPLVEHAPAPLRALASSGFVGVSFFYVLSGFVLAIGEKRRIADGTFEHRAFLARRLSRVAPAYFAAWLILIAPLLVGGASSVSASVPGGLLQLAMLQAWWPPLALTWNLPAWSISVELAFYLVFPALVRALLRLPTWRARFVVLGGLWMTALALAGAYSWLAPDGAVGPDSNAFFIDFLKFFPPARLPEFAFGLTLGLAFDRKRAAPRWLGPLALAAAVVLLAASDRVPFALVHNALLLPAFGALVWAAASAQGGVARFLGSRPLVGLGRASYAIYILQMPLMYAVLAAHVALAGAQFFVFFALLVYGAGIAFHLAVERRGYSLVPSAAS